MSSWVDEVTGAFRLAFASVLGALCALGLPCPPVFFGAFWATGLALDGFGRAVFTQAEFLAALIVLDGAYPPEFPLLLLSEEGLAGLVSVLCLVVPARV